MRTRAGAAARRIRQEAQNIRVGGWGFIHNRYWRRGPPSSLALFNRHNNELVSPGTLGGGKNFKTKKEIALVDERREPGNAAFTRQACLHHALHKGRLRRDDSRPLCAAAMTWPKSLAGGVLGVPRAPEQHATVTEMHCWGQGYVCRNVAPPPTQCIYESSRKLKHGRR